MKLRFNPWDVGWRIGDAHEPRGGELWVPWDRTAGVIGPQGSGKTLDLLTPALLSAPGAALVTLTKVEDLLLSLTERSREDRPCVVLDPFGLAEGVVDELIWDPIAGCVDPKVAERRAKAFTAGTVKGAITGGTGDDAARFVQLGALPTQVRDVGNLKFDIPVPDNVREVRGADPRLELSLQPSNGEIALNGASAVLSGQRCITDFWRV